MTVEPQRTAGRAWLEVTDLHKAYRKGETTVDVLCGVSFAVARGEMVSVIGKSGAGKSTLLHLLGTLDAPDRGRITLDGVDLGTLSSGALADLRNQQIGFVFQFHHLLPEFTALENVMMPALIRRMPRAQAAVRAQAVLTEVDLGHRLTHRPGELSGGEQQRVALARALVLDPPLLLADEVTGNLDQKTGEGIHQLLFELNRKRAITLIVVTHNLTLADRMPRRLNLTDGKIEERA